MYSESFDLLFFDLYIYMWTKNFNRNKMEFISMKHAYQPNFLNKHLYPYNNDELMSVTTGISTYFIINSFFVC